MAQNKSPHPALKLWSIIEMLRTQRQMDYDTLAVKVHCHERTVYNDRMHPEKMPLERTLRYFGVLGVTPMKIIQALMRLVAEQEN